MNTLPYYLSVSDEYTQRYHYRPPIIQHAHRPIVHYAVGWYMTVPVWPSPGDNAYYGIDYLATVYPRTTLRNWCQRCYEQQHRYTPTTWTTDASSSASNLFNPPAH